MTHRINAADFDLAASLECGQAFRWTREADGWYHGVVGRATWRLRQQGDTLYWQGASAAAGTAQPPAEMIVRYLSLDRSLPAILETFPADPHLAQAVRAHRGLRVLRQEPWETLASFIASSTKQIVQIRQIVGELARRFGEPINDHHHAFPSPERLARCTQQELWDCKLGFRAKHLLAAARAVADGRCALFGLERMEFDRALEELVKLVGVGEKIALCTMLFGCGFDRAFPIDVWVERSLRRLYFPRRRRTARQLREFTRSHFGPHAGWAQQYLFFAERRRGRAGSGQAA